MLKVLKMLSKTSSHWIFMVPGAVHYSICFIDVETEVRSTDSCIRGQELYLTLLKDIIKAELTLVSMLVLKG